MYFALHTYCYIAALPLVVAINVEPVVRVKVMVQRPHLHFEWISSRECLESTGRMFSRVILANEHGVMRSR